MRKYIGTIIITVILIVTVVMPAGAQDSPDAPEMIEAVVFGETAPVMEEAEELAEPPTLTEAQLANLEWAAENTPGALPVIEGAQAEPAGPEPGTEMMEAEARNRSGQPLLPEGW